MPTDIPPPDADGRLVALAHDLLNSVAFVRAQVQLLKRRIVGPGETDLGMVVDRLDRIERSTSRMTGLVDNLHGAPRPPRPPHDGARDRAAGGSPGGP